MNQKRGRGLIKLVTHRLPQEFDVPTITDGWPAIGVGLLSRMATTLRFILDLQPIGYEADASTLGRSLYEHGVHFAWLAADPAPRVLEWRRADLTQRLRLDADMRRHGTRVFTDEKRAQVEAMLVSLGGPKELHVEQLAIAADQHWLGQIPALTSRKDLYSFSGLYASLYRGYSSFAHPSEVGLFRVTDTLGGGRVRVRTERHDPDRNGPYGMAAVLFGLALFVASHSIGWPAGDRVHALFERYPAIEPSSATGRRPRWLSALLSRLRPS